MKLSYLSPIGGRYKGQLTITENELLFESNFDATFERFFKNEISQMAGKKCFRILKDDISSVGFKRSFFAGHFYLSLNGKQHVFRKWAISKHEIVKALKQ